MGIVPGRPNNRSYHADVTFRSLTATLARTLLMVIVISLVEWLSFNVVDEFVSSSTEGHGFVTLRPVPSALEVRYGGLESSRRMLAGVSLARVVSI